MHELDPWKAWRERRASLARQGVASEHLDELEDHLCCELDAHSIDEPSELEGALAQALEQLGAPSALANEYRKVHPPMNVIPKLAGIACSLGVVLLALGRTAELQVLINAPAVLLIGGFVAGGLWACFGLRRVVRAIAAGWRTERTMSPDELAELDAVAVRGSRLAWAGGVVGVLAGLISTALNLSDPAEIGPAIGMSLMSLLYGALLAEIGFGSLRSWLRNRSALAFVSGSDVR
ncbi:MAG: hypothetical protein IT454_16400 [Planctomycetes bacterium]|nr:hypothetical protein [Planctomycetota bacterium]